MQNFATLPVVYPLPRTGKTDVLLSCALGFLSEEDAVLLVRQTALNTVVDLRTDEEDAELPDFQIPGVLYLYAPLPPAPYFPDLASQWSAIFTSDEGLNSLRRVFDVLLHRTGGAILLHCSDGHERCDAVTALLLLALGIERDALSAHLPDCPLGVLFDEIDRRGGIGEFFRLSLGYRTDVLPALRKKFPICPEDGSI